MDLTDKNSKIYFGEIEAFYRSLSADCLPWIGLYVERKLDDSGQYACRLLHNSRGIDGVYWQEVRLTGSEIMSMLSGKLRIIPLRYRDKIGHGYFKIS